MIRILFLTLFLLAACRLTTEPDLPRGAVPLDPPVQYRLWWDVVQECSGRSGEFMGISWYQVPGVISMPPGSGVTGLWYKQSNAIVLAGGSVMDGEVVRHEMLHSLIQAGGHPREDFQIKCGGIVSCSQDCLDEGGGAPLIPPQAPQVGIGELLFSVRVLPQTSSFELDSGAVAVIVTATNPSDSPVWVAIAARTFAVTFQPVGGGESFQQVVGASASRIGFEAGLSRHQVFDFVLPPGLYTVEASFSRTAVAGTEYQVD